MAYFMGLANLFAIAVNVIAICVCLFLVVQYIEGTLHKGMQLATQLASLPLTWQTGGPFKRRMIFQVPIHRYQEKSARKGTYLKPRVGHARYLHGKWQVPDLGSSLAFGSGTGLGL